MLSAGLITMTSVAAPPTRPRGVGGNYLLNVAGNIGSGTFPKTPASATGTQKTGQRSRHAGNGPRAFARGEGWLSD
jgi:hypothetical protein